MTSLDRAALARLPAMAILEASERTVIVRMIRDHQIFAALNEVALTSLVGRGEIVAYAPGEILVRQDETGDAMFLILEGAVRIVAETSYGPVELAALAPGQLFGEIGAFASMPRTATIRADGAVRALRIARDAVVALGREHPEVFLAVIGLLGQRVGTINRAIGFYTQALAALEQPDFAPAILDDLTHPVPELVNFAHTFRRMAEQIVLRRAQRQEMANAAAIQRAMLPGAPPAELADRADLFAAMRPAKEVGGDLYDYFLLDADRLAFCIGDVSGKGVPAALFMAISRTVLRLALREQPDLGKAMIRANDLLSAGNEQSMFVTIFCGVLDLARGELAYCNCGHNPPLLLCGAERMEELEATGPPLAVMAGIAYPTRTMTMAPEDRLFLYTDGVTEATSAADELFGEERLRTALRVSGTGSSRALVEGVVAAVDRFVAEAPQFDDITALVLRYTPSSTTIPS
jgi:phosphoserine phosphatase RsbU/P